ncbi:MAG TPA: efflux RND transporter permease subunit, partial [Opitutaceae bacterium]|nr:efflux RND transporter permease subunit [Opitutaceae bacterium]
MNLAKFALARSRITFFAAIAILFAGAAAYLDFPAQEEPTLPVRAAAVAAYFPGLPTRQMEQLVARPIEDRIRSMPELKHLSTRVRTGQVLMTVEIDDRFTDLPPIWQRLRARMNDVAPTLPTGTYGPFVDDEYGRVAVASLAVTGADLTPAELRREARRLRDGLFQLAGVESVNFHGLPEEAIYLEMRGNALQQAGLTLQSVAADLQRQNIVLAGGEVRLGVLAASVTPTGDLRSVDELRRLPISLPAGGSVPLGELVEVRRSLVDPPNSVVLHNGERAVVLAISMREGINVISFGRALRTHTERLVEALPAGAHAEFVTFQGDVVDHDIAKTKRTFYETLVIVMIVVVGFIGWRAGWIVGTTVPLTLLASLLVMKFFGITLNNVTLAALIISLGLLVDNGIVIAEDILRRLAAGEERASACTSAGRSLAVPLLTATLACVAAFLPLMLMKSAVGEYTRNLSWVITIALLASWVLSLLIVPLLSYHFAKVPAGHAAAESDAAYATPFYRKIRRLIERVQSHRAVYVAAMLVLLALAGVAALRVPAAFLAESNRRQLRLFWELPSGTSSAVTAVQARELSAYLRQNRERWHLT